MQGIKKRRDRLYTQDSQNTSKQQITSRLNTAASLSFSQNSGALEINSLVKNRQFLSSPRYGRGQQSHYNIDYRLQSIDSSLTLNPQVREIDVRQLLSVISMIKFLVFSNSQQTKYIIQKQQSNDRLKLKMEEKEYGVESNKLKIERKRVLFQKKKHQVNKLRQQKEHILDRDIFEMTFSITEMKRKLTHRNTNKIMLALENKQMKEINRKGSHQYFGVNNMHIPIQSNQLKEQMLQNPNNGYQNKSHIYPFFQLQHKTEDNKIKSNKYQQSNKKREEIKEEIKQLDKLPSQQKIRDSITSNKWKNDDEDDEDDEELVQFLSNSIKKTQKQPNHSKYKPNHINQQEQNQIESHLKEQQIITFVEDNSSVVNITYESSDKRHSKSQDYKEDTFDQFKQHRKKDTLNQSPVKIEVQMSHNKTSPQKRARAVTLNQSPIKIEVQMSHSKVSSSRGDISKTNAVLSKCQSSLQEHFQQIDEESEELASLKNSPLEAKVSSSSSQQSSSVQLQKSSKLRQTENLVSLSPAESALKNPPNLLQGDNLAESVQMQYSANSQQMNWQRKYLLPQSTGESEQDILDSINLLHESRISRQKVKDMKDVSSTSWCLPKKRDGESTIRDSDFGQQIGPLPTQSRVLSKSSGSAIQQSMVRRRSTIVMNRLSEKNVNNKVSLPIEQVQEEQDKLPSD